VKPCIIDRIILNNGEPSMSPNWLLTSVERHQRNSPEDDASEGVGTWNPKKHIVRTSAIEIDSCRRTLTMRVCSCSELIMLQLLVHTGERSCCIKKIRFSSLMKII
jgi:hypothetical protein